MLARAVTVIAVSLLAAILPSALARAQTPALTAVVGTNDAFVITLTDASGNRVTHLDPGTYTIVVHDRSEMHNFHLTGPGVDQKTVVDAIGDTTWTVTLADGTYTYVCDPHALTMRGSFTVGAVQTPPATANLRASVGPGRRISLRNANGTKTVRLEDVASATVVVTDRSKTENFHLTGPGVNRKTGIKFRGRATWKLALSPGTYRYRSDRHKTLRGSFVVTAPGARAS